MNRLLIDRRRFLLASLAGGAAAVLPGAAPAAADPALGRVLLRSTARERQADVPLSFGVAAPKGAVPPGNGVAASGLAAPSQLDWFNSWPDGSLRFGVLSVVVPVLEPLETKTLRLVRGGSQPGDRPGVTVDELRRWFLANGGPPVLSWHDRDRGRFTADAGEALAAGREWNPRLANLGGRWLSGPVCTEWVCSAPLRDTNGRPHPILRAWFHCRAWRSRAGIVAVRSDVILDNGLGPTDPEVVEVVGDLEVRRGDAVVWRRVGGPAPPGDLLPDSHEGRPFRGADRCVVLRGGGAGLGTADRFKLLDADGTIVHLLEPAADGMVGRIVWRPDALARGALTVAGPLPLTEPYLGEVRLPLSRRVRIAAENGQDLSSRRFVIEGRAADGGGIGETIRGPSPGKASVGRFHFAAVTRVVVDGPTGGEVSVGTAPLPGPLPAGSWRLWGMALAPWTRWPVRVWHRQPAAELQPDPAMFIGARLLPNYDGALRPAGLARFVADLAGHLDWECDPGGNPLPNSRRRDAPHAVQLNIVLENGQGGGRPDLAPIPGQQAAWAFQPDRDAWRVMTACGTAMNQWPWHWKDRRTGQCVDPDRLPDFTTHFNASHLDRPRPPVAGNTLCDNRTDREHWLDFSFLPFLTSGDLVHYEAMMQAAVGAWAANPSRWPWRTDHNGYERCAVEVSPRNVAWVCRTFGNLRACGPDRLYDPGVTAPRAIVDRIWESQQRWLARWFAEGPDMYGLMPADKGDHKTLMIIDAPEHPYAPWMHSFLSAVFGHLAEMEVLNGDGRAFLDWYRSYSVDMADPARTNPAAVAFSYYWRARRPDGRPIASIAEAYRQMAEGEWPQPSSHLFKVLEPSAELTLAGDAARPGALIAARAETRTALGGEGVFDRRFLGRELFVPADGGLAIVTALGGGDRSNDATLRVVRPFAGRRHHPRSWRLQYPAAGPSHLLALDHTQEIGDYAYHLMAALASLTAAGTPGAAEAWRRLRGMARNSGADFPDAPGWLCGWAIAPR